MSGVNKVIVVGRLGVEPELKETSGGTKVCRLSVATSRTWTNQQSGEKQEETEWHRITVWGKQAENCHKYLAKGRQVYVEGRLRTSKYQKDDVPGIDFYSTEIVADQVQFLGGKGDSEGGGGGDSPPASSSSGPNTSEPDPDDDIPF